MWIGSLRCCLKVLPLRTPALQGHNFSRTLSNGIMFNKFASSSKYVRPRGTPWMPKYAAYGYSMSANSPAEQKYDYFFVLDFEATCDRTPIQPQEIIEFPCLKLNGKTLEVEASFHQYVQPRVHKELTSYCIELTGIVQDMVDNQPDIEVTLQSFNKWLEKEGALNDGVSFTFVTCGDWDLNIMLPNECQYFKLPIPSYMNSWINIKKPFVNVTGIWPKGLLHMMSIVGLKHEGRLHSGIDDCRNLAKVLKLLHEKGYVFDITEQR